VLGCGVDLGCHASLLLLLLPLPLPLLRRHWVM
jgi:hypothetical protein